MISGFIYYIRKPKSNIISLTTNTDIAEKQSKQGYIVTSHRYKVIGWNIRYQDTNVKDADMNGYQEQINHQQYAQNAKALIGIRKGKTMSKNKAIIGAIINHRNGVGFKLTFDDKETAQHYKDMFDFIIRSDNIKTEVKKGYYEWYE